MRLLFTLSLLIAISSLATGNSLVVHQKTGNTAIDLSNISRITFPSDGGMAISLSDGSTQSYTHENLYSLKFNTSTSGITPTSVNMTDNNIRFDGTSIILPYGFYGITVYSLDGSIVAMGTSSQLDVTYLVPGVYIVKSGCLTAKIIK